MVIINTKIIITIFMVITKIIITILMVIMITRCGG